MLTLMKRTQAIIFCGALLFFYKVTVCSLELTMNSDVSTVLQEHDSLFDRLINDPLAVLAEIKKTEYELEKLECQGTLTPKILQQKITERSNVSPLVCISECNSCVLSRSWKNGNREFYESKVLNYLRKCASLPTINYVSFAAGGLFQDLVILTKAVRWYGIKNINVHIVDPSYAKYVEILRKKLSSDGILDLSQSISFHALSLEHEQDLQTQQECEMYLIERHQRFNEFVSLLRILSDNSIKVYVHKNADTYADFCAKDVTMQADLIATIDFDPLPAVFKSSVQDFYKLIYRTLKKGCYAVLSDFCFNTEKLTFLEKSGNACIILKKVISPWSDSHQRDSAFYTESRSFIGVYYKKNDFPEEYVASFSQKYPILFSQGNGLKGFFETEAPSLEHNEYIGQHYEFRGLSTTSTLKLGVCLAACAYGINFL